MSSLAGMHRTCARRPYHCPLRHSLRSSRAAPSWSAECPDSMSFQMSNSQIFDISYEVVPGSRCRKPGHHCIEIQWSGVIDWALNMFSITQDAVPADALLKTHLDGSR